MGTPLLRIRDFSLAYPETASRDRGTPQPSAWFPAENAANWTRTHWSQPARWVFEKKNLSISSGEIVGIVGPSGCGKSRTFHAALGLLDPVLGPFCLAGRAFYRAQELNLYPGARQTREEKPHHRTGASMDPRALPGNQISFLFQESQSSFHPYLSLEAQVRRYLKRHLAGLSHHQAWELLRANLAAVGLPEKKLSDRPRAWSGGMLQRLNLALGLVSEPELLIADEATSALDVTSQASIMDLLTRLQAERHLAVFFISHDLDLVREFCPRVEDFGPGEGAGAPKNPR